MILARLLFFSVVVVIVVSEKVTVEEFGPVVMVQLFRSMEGSLFR